jgi:hypothetical protein
LLPLSNFLSLRPVLRDGVIKLKDNFRRSVGRVLALRPPLPLAMIIWSRFVRMSGLSESLNEWWPGP